MRPRDLNAIVGHSRVIVSVKIEGLHAGGTAVSVVTSPRSVPLVLNDASEPVSALMNLILNAFDAMPNGGTVIIHRAKSGMFARLPCP